MPSLFLWKDKKAFTFTVEAFFMKFALRTAANTPLTGKIF